MLQYRPILGQGADQRRQQLFFAQVGGSTPVPTADIHQHGGSVDRTSVTVTDQAFGRGYAVFRGFAFVLEDTGEDSDGRGSVDLAQCFDVGTATKLVKRNMPSRVKSSLEAARVRTPPLSSPDLPVTP